MIECHENRKCSKRAADWRGRRINFEPKQNRMCDDCPIWMTLLAAAEWKDKPNKIDLLEE